MNELKVGKSDKRSGSEQRGNLSGYKYDANGLISRFSHAMLEVTPCVVVCLLR